MMEASGHNTMAFRYATLDSKSRLMLKTSFIIRNQAMNLMSIISLERNSEIHNAYIGGNNG